MSACASGAFGARIKETHNVSDQGEAVLAVVEDSHPKVVFRQVSPFVAATSNLAMSREVL